MDNIYNSIVPMKSYADILKKELKENVGACTKPPHLVVIQIGDDNASNSYVNGKKQDCNEVGIKCTHKKFNNNVTESYIVSVINECNNDPEVDGIIVQLPLPKHINIKKVQNAILRNKDVDGFKKDSCFKSCTPLGIMNWLMYNNISLEGKIVTIIGRSEIVGKPLANMMIGATVISCNSHTRQLHYYTQLADIVISAIGKPKYLTDKYFLNDTLLIDVGINRDYNGRLCGDVDRENVEKNVKDIYITPVPGSVGLMTRVALLENTYNAFILNNKLSKHNSFA